ncbi:hypothetical protein AZE42_06131, partial [Rhizopogon vesiculosus]
MEMLYLDDSQQGRRIMQRYARTSDRDTTISLAHPPQPPPRMTEAAHRIVRSSAPIRAFDNIGEVAAVTVFPDRRRMATTSPDGILRVWDLKKGIILNELEGRGEGMES